MLFPRLPRAFTRKFHKTENKRERTIQGNFLIAVPPGSEISDSFPRRVTLGEVLLDSQGLRILSPVNGIAALTSDHSHFQIKQDGGWRTDSPFQSKNHSLKDLFSKFREGALASLDFSNLSLETYFSKFHSDDQFHIYFSPYTRFNHLAFKYLVFTDMEQAFNEFELTMKTIFPNAKIHNFLNTDEKSYQHPDGIPEYFVSTKSKSSIDVIKRELDEYKILYLGSETIYHILRMLYYDEPFTRRHLSVCLVDRKGRIDTESRNFLLTNGQSLEFLTKNFNARYKIASFQSMFEQVSTLDIRALGNFNIYEHFILTLYERVAVVRKEFLCISCSECDTYCPTSASPFALISGLSDHFKKEKCIECGICTLYCPSGINIRGKILEAKKS